MNYSDNHFSFDCADAVVIRERIGNLLHGTVAVGESPKVTLRREEENYYLDFVLAAPIEPVIDTALDEQSGNPVANAVIHAALDGLEGTLLDRITLCGRGKRIAKSASDTVMTLDANAFYVFPTMTSLSVSLADPADGTLTNEYRFRFTSGSTPTSLSLPSSIKGDMSIEANHVYEVSIVDNYLTYQSWEV